MTPDKSHNPPTVKSYLMGYILALILTIIPFALAAFHNLSRLTALIVIAALAVVQMLVHLRFFLHLDLKPASRDKLVILIFSGILASLMVGGTLWIMFDLNIRMAVSGP